MELVCKSEKVDGFKKKFNGSQYVVIIKVLKNARGDYWKMTRINGRAMRSIIFQGTARRLGWSILMNKLNRLKGRAILFQDWGRVEETSGRNKIHLGLFNIKNYVEVQGCNTGGIILRRFADTNEEDDEVETRIKLGSFATIRRVQRGLGKDGMNSGTQPKRIWKVRERGEIIGESKETLENVREEGESKYRSRSPKFNELVGPKIRMENRFEALNLLQLYDEDVESQLERSYPNTLADELNSGPIQGKSGMGPEPSRNPIDGLSKNTSKVWMAEWNYWKIAQEWERKT
ncbi:hypothetical protein L484_011429 [Morus notabilis]|uniref:Uncharacterized protein n=1 Tax=Morus notabilis TaxID=981085 RepID=W9QKQ8_9ROSA|nr:hypothetical protein L484_011429 [Morus notabilis]